METHPEKGKWHKLVSKHGYLSGPKGNDSIPCFFGPAEAEYYLENHLVRRLIALVEGQHEAWLSPRNNNHRNPVKPRSLLNNFLTLLFLASFQLASSQNNEFHPDAISDTLPTPIDFDFCNETPYLDQPRLAASFPLDAIFVDGDSIGLASSHLQKLIPEISRVIYTCPPSHDLRKNSSGKLQISLKVGRRTAQGNHRLIDYLDEQGFSMQRFVKDNADHVKRIKISAEETGSEVDHPRCFGFEIEMIE